MNSKFPLIRKRTRLPRLLRWAAWAFCLATCAASAAPAHLIISAPVGAAGAAGLPELLAQWRQQGLVSDVWAIDSTEGAKAAFGTLAVLEFPNDDCLVRWQQAGAPALGAGLTATKVNQLARGETFPRDSTKAVFLVAAYDVTAPPERYRLYSEGYVAPEMESLRTRRDLISYFLFAAQDRASAPWHSVLIMEYREPTAYAERDAEMAAVRADLAGNAAWKQWSDVKKTIRREQSLTPAKWDLLPPPLLSDLPSYRPEQKLTGTIRVLGSFLKFAVAALEEGFNHYQPDIQFANNFTTSSEGAIGGLCTGVSDLATAGDDAKIPDLMPFFNVYGHMPLEISVATGDYEKRGALWPAAIVVNKANPISHLSLGELDRIFGAERTGGWDVGNNAMHDSLFSAEFARGKETNIRTWDQLGLTGEWAGKEIQTYGYIAPGFAVYFQRRVMHWSTKYNPNFREFVEPKEAVAGPLGKAVSSDCMLQEISNDPYGIGWVAMFHAKYYPNLKVLAIAARDGGPYIPYTPETVSNHTYPLVRDAYFYVNREPGRPMDPRVREFLRFVLSREGQQIIAHTGFFYPLTADHLKEQLKKLD